MDDSFFLIFIEDGEPEPDPQQLAEVMRELAQRRALIHNNIVDYLERCLELE